MRSRLALLLGLSLAAAACSRSPEAPATPPFYQRLDAPGRAVDPVSAVAMINLYRQGRGLAPLAHDPRLDRVAAAQAEAMARAESPAAGRAEAPNLATQLTAAGVRSDHALVSTTAGYRTFAEAFSGWREAARENARLLDPKATRFGLAAVYAPSSKYKVFWAAVYVAAD